MIVSTKGRYALRILTALAGRDGCAPLRELAEAEDVPFKYAEAIASLLVKARAQRVHPRRSAARDGKFALRHRLHGAQGAGLPPRRDLPDAPRVAGAR